jgi:phosphatidylethanolamine/phosphatidyl-N-methylethanolamine N-methyltransferase
MSLFDRKVEPTDELLPGSDIATRALSVTVVENDFVEAVYSKIAKVYDLTFGPTLHPGRLQAIQRMDIQSGERVLEVGVGTGINLSLYPKKCSVTGIDFSAPMLEIARERAERKDVRNVRLLQMDAADMKFADDSFDIVYAPYVISVVPDPVKVAQEMRRVCRPGGRIIVLNHFLSPNPLLSRIERLISPFTIHIGFKADLDLPAFLTQAGLQPESIERVNIPRLWSLVTTVK